MEYDGDHVVEVLTEPPTQERYAYRTEILFNYGVKLGGTAALARPGETDPCEDASHGRPAWVTYPALRRP